MRLRSPLNELQLAVLRCVGDGDDLQNGNHRSKRSACALHDRGLLVVRRSPWRAEVTEVGRFYLEHGRYPDKPIASAPTGRLESRGPAGEPSPPRGGGPASNRPAKKRGPPRTTARTSASRRSTAEALIGELVDAGEKVIRAPDDATVAEWRKVVDFAKRHQLVPAGKRIEKQLVRAGHGALFIRLLPGVHPNSRVDDGPTIPMPIEMRDLHPVVKRLQADAGRLRMSSSLRHRCLLYLHGLTQEAVRRGYVVREEPIAAKRRGRITTYGRPGVPDYSLREGELNIVVNGFSYRITIDQLHPEAEDDERYDQLYVWVRGLGHSYHGCRTHWRDGKRANIDDSIGSVLGEIEAWAASAKREQDDRRARWQAAMDQATRMATHDRLVAELEDQVKHWRQMKELQQYCDALEVRIQDADDDEPVDEARRWLAWARDHAEIMNPLCQLPVTPTPKLRPEELEPYLDGWSPRALDVYVPRWRGYTATSSLKGRFQ
jgi:hypothetical protein